MSSNPPQPKAFKSKAKSSISWSSAGTETLKDTIARVTDSGNAIMFSRTMDGSALSLTLFMGNQKSKEYVTEVGDIVPLLAWAIEEYS